MLTIRGDAWRLLVMACLGAAPAWTQPATPVSPASTAPAQAPTVFLDIVVENAQSEPIESLTADEIEVTQDETRQTLATFQRQPTPGHYELSYVPASGRAAAVTVRIRRNGARVRGPQGDDLVPRVIKPPSPLEQELLSLLEQRPTADDFATQAAALHFDNNPQGQQHALVFELSLDALTPQGAGPRAAVRVQMLARVKDGTGNVLHLLSADRALPAEVSSPAVKRLVWTMPVRLPPGAYVLESVARDVYGARVSVRQVPFAVATAKPESLALSSVTLVQPDPGQVIRDQAAQAGDPFAREGEPLMPTLGFKVVAAPGGRVEFFVIVYPKPGQDEPVTARVHLVRDDAIAGSTPIPLPAPDEHGAIRYAGSLPTRALRPAQYRLRFQVQQGDEAVYEEAPFEVLDPKASPAIVLRALSADALAATAAAPSAEETELDQARALLRAQNGPLALSQLIKLDTRTGGTRLDVRLLLGAAYYQVGARKDAEEVAQALIAHRAATPAQRAEAYFLLGRSQAAGESAGRRAKSAALRDAEASFRQVVELDPKQAAAGTLARAETLFRLERDDEARALLATLAQAPALSEDHAMRLRQLQRAPRCAHEPCLPDLTFVSAEGRHLTQEDLRGKVVLLTFWASWCEPCVAALPDLRRLEGRNRGEPFVMLGVNVNDEPAQRDAFLRQHGVAWPQISAGATMLLERLGLHVLPADLVFDHEGVLVGSTTGWTKSTAGRLAGHVDRAITRAKKARAPR